MGKNVYHLNCEKLSLKSSRIQLEIYIFFYQEYRLKIAYPFNKCTWDINKLVKNLLIISLLEISWQGLQSIG